MHELNNKQIKVPNLYLYYILRITIPKEQES